MRIGLCWTVYHCWHYGSFSMWILWFGNVTTNVLKPRPRNHQSVASPIRLSEMNWLWGGPLSNCLNCVWFPLELSYKTRPLSNSTIVDTMALFYCLFRDNRYFKNWIVWSNRPGWVKWTIYKLGRLSNRLNTVRFPMK